MRRESEREREREGEREREREREIYMCIIRLVNQSSKENLIH